MTPSNVSEPEEISICLFLETHFQYNSATSNVDVDSISLFNCKKEQYISLQNNKYLIVENNSNNSVSFILGGSKEKEYCCGAENSQEEDAQ